MRLEFSEHPVHKRLAFSIQAPETRFGYLQTHRMRVGFDRIATLYDRPSTLYQVSRTNWVPLLLTRRCGADPRVLARRGGARGRSRRGRPSARRRCHRGRSGRYRRRRRAGGRRRSGAARRGCRFCACNTRSRCIARVVSALLIGAQNHRAGVAHRARTRCARGR